MSIHAELQPRTNMDGVGDANYFKRHSETTSIELRGMRKDFCTGWKNRKLWFWAVLLFPLRWRALTIPI